MRGSARASHNITRRRRILYRSGSLNTYHKRLNESYRDLCRLPANGSSLIERVRRARATELLDNVLKTAIRKRGSAVSILTKDEYKLIAFSAHRHRAGKAALGLSCGACFEELACVFASYGALYEDIADAVTAV